jgi:membrane-bound serine protease (ClpP class)
MVHRPLFSFSKNLEQRFEVRCVTNPGMMQNMNLWRVFLFMTLGALVCSISFGAKSGSGETNETRQVVYVLPIRNDISEPMAYLVRRGVKEAMRAEADLLVIDMETNGGRIDSTEKIIESLGMFKGKTVTFVNRKAFSAGAFIAVATQQIFMAPQSVIGAAAPVMMGPGGGVQDMPETLEAKSISAVRALVRTRAEKNGYNVQVVEAMIDKSREVTIDGEVINEKGQILTLTNVQAEKEYGDPPKPLLSSGTIGNLEALLDHLGYKHAAVHRIEPTGAERVATWLSAIAPLLMLIGIAGIYLEMKTPGFGIPGIVGISAFAMYFLSSYIAGLAGLEWLVLFLLGLGLVILELLIMPGIVLVGLTGAVLMIMALVDIYPGMPRIPSLPQLQTPVLTVLSTLAVGTILMAVLSRFLLKTPMFNQLVSHTASAPKTTTKSFQEQTTQVGWIGVTISPLRPGGKANFDGIIMDVLSQGEMLAKGTKVKIIGFSGRVPIVDPVV